MKFGSFYKRKHTPTIENNPSNNPSLPTLVDELSAQVRRFRSAHVREKTRCVYMMHVPPSCDKNTLVWAVLLCCVQHSGFPLSSTSSCVCVCLDGTKKRHHLIIPPSQWRTSHGTHAHTLGTTAASDWIRQIPVTLAYTSIRTHTHRHSAQVAWTFGAEERAALGVTRPP